MDAIFKEKPPWKSVEWIRSPPWTPVPVSYTEWIPNLNQEALDVKERIGKVDSENKWELAKKMVNPYELVYTHNDERLPPPLSLVQPLSRSYFKMVELLDVLDFFQGVGTTKIRTAHVAEGPGGFIQAVYQVAEDKKKQIANSYAITLKPTSQHVPGWKKATSFLHRYKQVRIHYGEDNTGDIYTVANQASFIKICNPGVHLFTADGGFDFSVDYTKQEQNVFHLLICSARTGLQTLLKGGSFVMKLFDCMSPHTQLLAILIGRCFQEWTLYKPAMTRPCNSERYILGRGFRGFGPELQALFATMQEKSAQGLYPMFLIATEGETTFLAAHIDSSTKHQIHSIEQAIVLSTNQDMWWRELYGKCLDKSYVWCEHFHVMSVPRTVHVANTAALFPGQKGL